MQFHCASCGREIVSRYDGRLVWRNGSLPIQHVTAFLIHRWCQRNWEQENRESWVYSDLKRVVEAGGR